jgi:hypothetical protein
MNQLIFFVISYLLLFPEPKVDIKADINKTTMTVGEVLVYTVQINYPEKTRLIGDPVTDFNDFEITRIQEYEPARQNGKITKRTEYLLTTFNIDTFLIRGPVLRYMSNGDTVSVQGESKMIIVTSVLDSAANDIRPEKPIIEGEINWFGLIASGFGILIIVGVILYFLYLWYKRYQMKRLKELTNVPVIKKTPEEEAMEQLVSLRKSKMPERGDFKLFHIEISNIIRAYIEKITPVHAMELPTSDFIRSLKEKTSLNESYILLLRTFLEVCDLVKFAKYQSAVQECHELYEQAILIVQRGAAFHQPTNEPTETGGS